jgi:hypothetical protein
MAAALVAPAGAAVLLLQQPCVSPLLLRLLPQLLLALWLPDLVLSTLG